MLRSPRLAAVLLAAFSLPLAAQQFPSQQRGLTADTAYSSGELDSVNLFNGNLSLGVPLGQPYPVGPSFSLGFALHYNSKIWDHEEKTCQQSFPTQEVEYFLPVPDKLANAGLGWLLTPGRLLDPSTVTVHNPLNDGPNWIYLSADGGQHSVQALPTAEATNRLTAATYDAAGNVTILPLPGSTWTYNFDGLRKMISLRSNSNQARLFFYDANDERIFAWDCPQSSCNPDHDFERWTLRGLGGEVLRSFSGTDKFATVWEEDFIYRGGGDLLASIRPGTQPGQEERRYVAVDHLGSVRQIFSEQNQSLDRFDFHPFGQESGTVAPGEIALKFTGHERDPNGTGKGLLDYMHARYCSPVTSRFLSVDPVLRRAGLPQSWNRYTYALNNPVKFTDPNGEDTANKLAVDAQASIANFKHDIVDAGLEAIPGVGGVVFAFAAGSVLDLASTALDALRFGDAAGTAIGSDASGGEIVLALAQDAGRGLTLAGGAGGVAGKILSRTDKGVDLFRAVSPAEFDDIMATGQFRSVPGSYEVKQFGRALGEVVKLANHLPEASAIVKSMFLREC